MARRDPDVVLPGAVLQFHRLGGAQPAARIPFADTQERSLTLTYTITVNLNFTFSPWAHAATVVDREQHTPAVEATRWT